MQQYHISTVEHVSNWMTYVTIIKIRCIDIQRQRQLFKMRQMRQLSLHRELKQYWGREVNTSYCIMKGSRCSKVQVRIWKLRAKVRIWKLRARGGMQGARCLLCIEESIFHLLLKCPEIQRWRGELLNNKQSHINKELALTKTLTVKNVTEQRQLGTVPYQIKCEWENQVKKGEMRKGEREN